MRRHLILGLMFVAIPAAGACGCAAQRERYAAAMRGHYDANGRYHYDDPAAAAAAQKAVAGMVLGGAGMVFGRQSAYLPGGS